MNLTSPKRRERQPLQMYHLQYPKLEAQKRPMLRLSHKVEGLNKIGIRKRKTFVDRCLRGEKDIYLVKII